MLEWSNVVVVPSTLCVVTPAARTVSISSISSRAARSVRLMRPTVAAGDLVQSGSNSGCGFLGRNYFGKSRCGPIDSADTMTTMGV